VLSCNCPLGLAVQMEAVSQPFFEVPYGVNDTVDRPENVISHRRNSEREFPNPGELREQAFSVQEPWIGQLVGQESLWRVHSARTWIDRRRYRNINLGIIINVFHQGHSL
jgi:hypothetical protein